MAKFINTKTGMEYDALGEVMLNKASTTEVRDGTRLVILKSPSGAILARPKSEFKSGRFRRVTEDDVNLNKPKQPSVKPTNKA